MKDPVLLAIGEVAADTGVKVSAVRYYDEIGIISAVGRVGGKRRFGQDTVGRVAFIRRAQEAGFSLEQIRTLLDDTRGGWRDLVDEKIVELSARRDRLDVVVAVLTEMRDCGCDVVASCPRFQPH